MSFEIQHQIKQNAQQIRSYVSDLYDWQQEMTLKQKAKMRVLKQQRAKQQEIKRQLQSQIEQQKKKQTLKTQEQKNTAQKSVDLVRDTNTIKDYYTAWDRFNIDKELEKLQQEQKSYKKPYNPYEMSQNYIRAKPKAKINISVNNQRAAVIDPTELKDKGNIHFKVCEYEKAIDYYTQCVQKLNEQQHTAQNNKLKCVVLSNRAMSYMKLNENSKALRDCTQSIKYDPTYQKSYLRRGECYKKLGSYLQSLSDFERVKQLDPKDKQIDNEIRKIQLYLQKLYKQAREGLIIKNPTKTAIPNSYRIPIQEVAEVQQVIRTNEVKNKQEKTNYLQEL